MPARSAPPIPAYRQELTLRGRRALLESIDLLTGDALEELPAMENNGLPFANTTLGLFFPHPELPRYAPSVVRRLVVCLLTAGFQLAQTTRYELACVGEELAMNALLSGAESIAAERGAPEDFGYFEDTVFDDLDFLQLWDAPPDGIMGTGMAAALHMVNLEFADWFSVHVQKRWRRSPRQVIERWQL